jgi:hypothetical protein
MNIPSVLKLIVVVFFLSILPKQVCALTPEQVFEKVKDSIIVVKTLDVQGKVKSQGSGVLLPSWKIATNSHVVKGGASYQVGSGKQLVRASLYAEDGEKDICLLDAKGIRGKPAQLGRAMSLKVGAPVYAVGAPQGLELSLSDGIVAQLRGGPPPIIQTTAAISPGSSGGGLFDSAGLLVGLTTLYLEGGQNLNFAMPVEWIGELRYEKYASGIVKDNKTGLEWYAGPNFDTTWYDAKCWVASLDVDGGGWRMPTREELRSLHTAGTGMTSLLKTTGWIVWSGEIGNSSSAWGFYVIISRGFLCPRDNSYLKRAFAVRSRIGTPRGIPDTKFSN